MGNEIVDHSDVVRASPVGTAPTTSSFSTWHLTSRDSAKTATRQYENILNVGIWCILYQRLDGTWYANLHGSDFRSIQTTILNLQYDLCIINAGYCQFCYTNYTVDLLPHIYRADSKLAPSQWETSLRSNAVSHCLGANLKSALYILSINLQ